MDQTTLAQIFGQATAVTFDGAGAAALADLSIQLEKMKSAEAEAETLKEISDAVQRISETLGTLKKNSQNVLAYSLMENNLKSLFSILWPEASVRIGYTRHENEDIAIPFCEVRFQF